MLTLAEWLAWCKPLCLYFRRIFLNLLYFSKIFTESEAEESGDEGVDGPDEEPPVGHQCHAYNAQMTREEKRKKNPIPFPFKSAFIYLCSALHSVSSSRAAKDSRWLRITVTAVLCLVLINEIRFSWRTSTHLWFVLLAITHRTEIRCSRISRDLGVWIPCQVVWSDPR